MIKAIEPLGKHDRAAFSCGVVALDGLLDQPARTFVGKITGSKPRDRHAETAPSIVGFAAIQGVQRKQDLAGLAPNCCFIPAEAIECVVGQIGETQKATRELGGRINGRSDRSRPRAGHDFCSIYDTERFRIAVETARVSPPE